MNGPSQKRNITAERAVAILKKNGVDIDEKNVEKVLDFLYFLAKLTVNQYIKDELKTVKNHDNSRSLHSG